MKLVIVSGLSGSGKSVALHTLEDLGYYCIDNLPAGLLSVLALELSLAPTPVQNAAVGIDARNLPQALQQFSEILEQLEQRGISSEILFLTCETETLIKRFSETRRRHPLSSSGRISRSTCRVMGNQAGRICCRRAVKSTGSLSGISLESTRRQRPSWICRTWASTGSTGPRVSGT